MSTCLLFLLLTGYLQRWLAMRPGRRPRFEVVGVWRTDSVYFALMWNYYKVACVDMQCTKVSGGTLWLDHDHL